MSIDSEWDDDKTGTHAASDTARDRQLALLRESARQQRQLIEELRSAYTSLPQQLTEAVERGVRRVIDDEEVGRRFWERGFKRLSDHTTNGISQWVGKRVMLILLAAALSASIGWAVVTGRLK